jgi:hypothetical protein
VPARLSVGLRDRVGRYLSHQFHRYSTT